MKYKKKPVIIEALQLTEENMVDVMSWCDECQPYQAPHEAGIIIPTLEGDHLAGWGDYVIKGIKGEFYPIKPDIFELTYELLDNQGEE